MTEKENAFSLKINAYSPATIPMARLAEYMAQFATLLGERDSVHFAGLEQGSTVLAAYVELEAVPKVRQRVRAAYSNSGDPDAHKAIKLINKLLKEDNGDAALLDGSATIIEFPGAHQTETPVFGPITQSSVIDGVVIRVGGKNETVTVTLQTRDGMEATCKATRPLAKELARYSFGAELRLSGRGRWKRNEDGEWVMEDFTVTSYEQLDHQHLDEVVADLRAVKGSGWAAIADPWEELQQIRGFDD
jgi:hypothetical protein